MRKNRAQNHRGRPKRRPRWFLHAFKNIASPYEVGARAFTVVYYYILSGHRLIDDGQKIRPLGYLPLARPLFQGSFFHDPLPERGRRDYVLIRSRVHAARGKAVHGSPPLRRPQREILHVADYAALARGVLGKFGARGGACRSYEEHALHIIVRGVLLAHPYCALQVHVYIAPAVLHARVVYYYVERTEVGQRVREDIADSVPVIFVRKPCGDHVYPRHRVPAREKLFRYGFADAAARARYEYFHTSFTSFLPFIKAK